MWPVIKRLARRTINRLYVSPLQKDVHILHHKLKINGPPRRRGRAGAARSFRASPSDGARTCSVPCRRDGCACGLRTRSSRRQSCAAAPVGTWPCSAPATPGSLPLGRQRVESHGGADEAEHSYRSTGGQKNKMLSLLSKVISEGICGPQKIYIMRTPTCVLCDHPRIHELRTH